MSAVEIRSKCMSDNDRARTRRSREWGDGDLIAVLAAMVDVMAVITFTLHRNSPLVATGPSVTASEPSTAGGIER